MNKNLAYIEKEILEVQELGYTPVIIMGARICKDVFGVHNIKQFRGTTVIINHVYPDTVSVVQKEVY